MLRVVRLEPNTTVSDVRRHRALGKAITLYDGETKRKALFLSTDVTKNLNGHKAFRVLLADLMRAEFLAFDPVGKQWYLGPLGSPEQHQVAELFADTPDQEGDPDDWPEPIVYLGDNLYPESMFVPDDEESWRLQSYSQDQIDLVARQAGYDPFEVTNSQLRKEFDAQREYSRRLDLDEEYDRILLTDHEKNSRSDDRKA